MKLHVIFEGGPAAGLLSTVNLGVFVKEDPPTELRLASGAMQTGEKKLIASVYRLVEFKPIPGMQFQYQASYRYTHDYNDLPVSLVDYLF